MRKIISISGNTGSGKSTLGKKLEQFYNNSLYIDIDKIVHSVNDITEVKNKYIELFGNQIISNGIVDRKILGKIILNDKNLYNEVLSLTFPYIESLIESAVYNNNYNVIILDWFAMPETKIFKSSSFNILCNTDYDERKKRVMQRDSIDDTSFNERENNKYSYANVEFDFIYDGSNDFELLYKLNDSIQKKKIALYAGSFDPITNGHIDVIKQTLALFDTVYVAVMKNPNKGSGFFSVDKRIEIIEEIFVKHTNLEVVFSNDSTIDLAENCGANYLIRGFRGPRDIEYEMNLRQFNKDMNEDINTIYFTTDLANSHISSSALRELISLGKPVEKYTHELVVRQLKNNENN